MMNSSSPLSSPLSSLGTISQPPSPSPAADYPSPPCSSVPDTRVPSEAGDAPDCDGPPPAKRRKVTQPKPRTTEYLDLRNFGEGSKEQIAQQDAQMKRLVSVLRGKRKIVVVAGAGISVSAGSSQNVDGIDTSLEPLATKVPLNSKGPWPKTIQLHGGLAKMVCSKCGHLQDFDASLFEGPEAPDCDNCVEIDAVRTAAGSRRHGIGRMRPRMVLYNEYNPDEEAIGAVSAADLKKVADAEMCSTTRDRKNGFTAWINLDGEPGGPDFKDCWDLIVRGECDEVARHAGLPNARHASAHNTAAADAFPTPGASPRVLSPTPTNAFSKLKAITKPKGSGEKVAAQKPAKRKAPADAKVKKPRAPPKPRGEFEIEEATFAWRKSEALYAYHQIIGCRGSQECDEGKGKEEIAIEAGSNRTGKVGEPVLDFDYSCRIVPESQAHGTRSTYRSNPVTYCSSKSYFSYEGLATV
ncbi:hypothetical protein EYC84_010036 [Monilinia fructicola]|uniref:Uncharacterized protein n=1 Tax=Monilinia fructicola TaxID=38448 RepID=A0A5M9JE62_MONFR|nr:hypothetical protein EYC84_010036 [Monilinia fructicola]